MLLCRRRVVCMLNFFRFNLSFEFEHPKSIDGKIIYIAFFMCGRPGSETAVVSLIEGVVSFFITGHIN
jgi:hypothetical protein